MNVQYKESLGKILRQNKKKETKKKLELAEKSDPFSNEIMEVRCQCFQYFAIIEKFSNPDLESWISACQDWHRLDRHTKWVKSRYKILDRHTG